MTSTLELYLINLFFKLRVNKVQEDLGLNISEHNASTDTHELLKVLNEQQKISKDLKATREQRIKRIEDGKSSWIGLIRMLEDEEVREREGREMEILKRATDKAKESLHEYHTYNDNKVDVPLLTPESIKENE